MEAVVGNLNNETSSTNSSFVGSGTPTSSSEQDHAGATQAQMLSSNPSASGSAASALHLPRDRREFEGFLMNAQMVHVFAFLGGVLIIVCGKRFPRLIAGVASVAFGIWVGLVIQDFQEHDLNTSDGLSSSAADGGADDVPGGYCRVSRHPCKSIFFFQILFPD